MNYSFLLVASLFMVESRRIYCRVSQRYRAGVCEFPSIYRDKVIRQCQLGATGQWWCPKDENYDQYNQRTLCPNTTMTYAGSDPGQFCHLPFVYNGREHRACIRAQDQDLGGVYWWCATTANYDTDRNKRWTRCLEQSEQLPCFFKDGGGRGINTECRQFNGKWVCHTERSEIRECPHTDRTFAGNSPGQLCHFPFLFGEKEYRSCITARRLSRGPPYTDEDQYEPYLWCATTANYNTDGRWTKCIDEHDVSLTVTDRRVIIPVTIVVGVLTLVLCLAAVLHFCCDHTTRAHKHNIYHHNIHQQAPSLHISMLDIAHHHHLKDHPAIPSAPPSYLEAVMVLHNQS